MAAQNDAVSQDNIATTRGSASAPSSKPKRVRTGCLTCRERHLKCDEGLPNCNNCRKSARECKRGVKLNFIDTQCSAPPEPVPRSDEWNVFFLDESRDIASEYKDGLSKYSAVDQDLIDQMDSSMTFEFSNAAPPSAPSMAHQSLPSIQGMLPGQGPDDAKNSNYFEHSQQQQHQQSQQQQQQLHEQQGQQQQPQQDHVMHSGSSAHSHMSMHHQQQFVNDQTQLPDQQQEDGTKEMLTTQEETLYMQVFVEEVGLWMDSMDPMKHFSRIMPFHALYNPMLLNAFLACGVRHLTLVNPAAFQEEKALNYYDVASRHLLRALQNPDRDSVICATTAAILNVYEIMTEKALPRMNHIAGARALIKECGWNAQSTGIGAACFWLNVGLESLSNMHFNWQSSWNPDDWGLDLDWKEETELGREEMWTHRMLYVIAKISDFRATIPRRQDASPQTEQMRRQERFAEWCRLKALVDRWELLSPRTMKPLAYLYPHQTASKSSFPEVWLIKRTTVIARLFYHTALVLLAQVNPIMTTETDEMRALEQHHSHLICGIVAHVKDRGVASVALRCLPHAAEALTLRREQEEVLEIFTRIHRETGWRIGFIPVDLQKKWGWAPTDIANGASNIASPAAGAATLPTHANPTSHLTPQQQQQMAAAAAMAASSNNANLMGVNGSPSFSVAQSPAPTQYQFDQYAEMQNLKAAAAEQQRRASMASLAAQSQASAVASPPSRMPPQGIVNPMFAAGLPKMYQEYYVAPVHQGSHAQQSHGGGQGLGLGMASGMFSGAGGTYGGY